MNLVSNSLSQCDRPQMAPASLPLHEFEEIAKSSSTLGLKLFAKMLALSNFSVFILLSIYVRRLLNIKPYKIS